jgi:pyrroloquinoline quinone biosynthesis protein B
VRLRVLGAAAGGGFPQWNAASLACRRARAGDLAAPPATQCSVALSADGARWALINASPDLRQQIEANPVLHPQEAPRSSPIAAVVLANGEVDAIAGLLTLREGTPFALYAHRRVLAQLDRNPVFEVVSRALVPRRELTCEESVTLADAAGRPLGIALRPFAALGKVPLYAEAGEVEPAEEAGDVLGLEIGGGGRRIVWLANCARITAPLRARIAGAALLLMDGTLWRDDELLLEGVGQKTGRRMGHVSMSGPDGAVTALAGLPVGRRIFIHVNNTNPALLADSAERAELAAAGWEVARDGMEIEL